ncbi:MAG: hypothetical protein JWQ27_363 [Ferruginibacter sp.]|nr:hypothetical protein [Ferruginibacter sp.]
MPSLLTPIVCLLSVILLSSCGQDTEKKQSADSTNERIVHQPAPDTLKSGSDKDSSKINNPTGLPATSEEKVAEIRREFNRINAAKLTTRTFTFTCDTEGTISYYLEDGMIVKIFIDWGFVGDGSSKQQYFYQDGKLIFVFETWLGAPANQPDIKTELRTYVSNDTVIRFMKDQTISPCTTCRFTNASRPYKVFTAFKTGAVRSALCP